MITVDEVIKSLSSNTNLSSEVKENLKELIVIFNGHFPNADLTNLNNRIGSLNIVKANKYVIKDLAKYDINNNVLQVNALELSKDIDGKNILMHQLLNIISSKNAQTKYIKSSVYTAIHEGYAAIVANNLVGNNGEYNPYMDEEIFVNLLSQIVTNKEIEAAYFSNNTAPLVSNLITIHNDPKEIKQLMDIAKYNFETRHLANRTSMLADIQKRLIALFLKKPNLTSENVEDFRNQLCGNSAIFGNDKSKYLQVDGIYQYYDNLTTNLTLVSPVISNKSM
jgi:hypothetical protein